MKCVCESLVIRLHMGDDYLCLTLTEGSVSRILCLEGGMLLTVCHCHSVTVSRSCCSVTKSCPTLGNLIECSMPLSPEVCLNSCPFHALYNHLIICHPLLLLPSIFPSIRVFSSESALPIRWPKYWSFSIRLSDEYSGLIPFRIDCFDLLAIQETLKSLHQHHSSKVSILSPSAFMVQLSHTYMTTGKTIALIIWTQTSP